MVLDRALLKDCETAREELREAEESLIAARREFERSVRRIYCEGGSTREIAQALGLSHQRVHQLIGAEPQSWWQRVLGFTVEPARGCSFCDRSAKQAAKLVAGPNVHICDRCIAAANSLMAQENKEQSAPFQRLPETSLKRCSFCGTRKRGLARLTAHGHQICSACAKMAGEIARAQVDR